MRGLAVLAEVLSVIRGHDHQRVRRPPRASEGGEQDAQGVIGGRHLAQVGAVLVFEAGWRFVGRVGIEEMHPEEEGARPAFHPGHRIPHHLLRRALRHVYARAIGPGAHGDGAVVVKPLGQPPGRV